MTDRFDPRVDEFATASSRAQTTRELYQLLRESHDRLVAALALAGVAHLDKAPADSSLPPAVRAKLLELAEELDRLDPFNIRMAVEAAAAADEALDDVAGARREGLYRGLAASNG